MPQPPAARGPATAARAWLLTTLLGIGAGVATVPLVHSLRVPDWTALVVLTAAVAATERWSLNARIGHVSQRLTLSEVPLLVGLFATSGFVLVLARVLGGTIALQVLRRQEPHKAAYNVAYLWVETLAVLAVFAALSPDTIADGVQAALLAVGVAAVVALAGAAAMTGAVSIMEGRLTVRHVPRAIRDGFPPSLATTAATTIGLILAEVDPVLLWAPAVVLLVLALAYRSHLGLLEAQTFQRHLRSITHRITGDAPVDTTVDGLITAARELMDAAAAGIRLPDGSGGHRWYGPDESAGAFDHAITVAGGAHDPSGPCCAESVPAVAAPIEAIDGAWLVVRFNERHQIARSDNQAVAMLANHASVALSNAIRGWELVTRAEEANHLAHHDPLTGLPNRTALMNRMTDAIKERAPFAVLLIDLDNFKEINDALGHSAGDSVLLAIADRCADLVPEMVLGRLGGDEFLAIVKGDRARALDAADRLRQEMGRTVVVGPYNLEVGSSVGVSLHPGPGDTVEELLKQADLAMYEAKAKGSGVEVFGVAAEGRAVRQLAISSGFRAALANDELTVVFQPIIDFRTGGAVAVEALARWTDAALGPVSPEEFVRVAEQSGLTAELTDHVLSASLGHLREWLDAGLDLRVTVNLSVRTLMYPGLARMVHGALRDRGIEPERLTLEITETAVLTDPGRTLPVLERLAQLGVSLAIDDFGTGYSSLAYLRQMPAHTVKIDKSFIIPMLDDAGAEPLVGGIIRLCHEMGFNVVGEGVENEGVQRRLTALGCDQGQGFGIARPMTPDLVPDWMREHATPKAVSAISSPH